MREYASAIECCDKVIGIDPSRADAWMGKGFALLAMGNYASAIESCDSTLLIDPNLRDAWMGKGMALFNLNRFNDAKKCFEKAKILGSPEGRQMLAVIEQAGY